MGCKGCSKRQNNKLNTYDWLCDVPDAEGSTDFVEVQFKNTRKGYYLNSAKIPLEKGDIVAVEASPGHDIGTVSLTGKLVLLQMKKNNVRTEAEPKRIYRKAKPTDIEKYEEAKAKEHATMIRSRQIAADLGLNMKIGDVEYQGDGNKAIFYYIADERVDFRQLIKVLAEAFRVRIEMKQIGARQEAGRIGGIGPCGIFNCLLMSQFWLIQRSREIAVKKIYGMSDSRIIGAMACNILALSVTALIIFAVSAVIINVVTSGAGIITVNLTTLLTTIAAIAVTIILSMAYPVIKILHYDSVEVLGSDD